MNLQLGAFLTNLKAPLSTLQVVSEYLKQLMVFVHHLCHASFLLNYLFISVCFGACWSQTNTEKLCMLLLHVHNTPLRRIHVSSGEWLNENWCDEPHVFYKGYTKKPLMKLWEVDSWVLIISWMLWLASHRALWNSSLIIVSDKEGSGMSAVLCTFLWLQDLGNRDQNIYKNKCVCAETPLSSSMTINAFWNKGNKTFSSVAILLE